MLPHTVYVENNRGLTSATYLVLYKALCHEYVGCKDLAVKYRISESTD